MELHHIPALQFFNTRKWQLLRQQLAYGIQLFHLLNGDIFYSIQTWPTNIQQHFGKKPTGDNDSFKLLLFFIGNGCSPEVIAKWILTSQHWAPHSKGEERVRQIDFIVQNLYSKAYIWFHFDIPDDEWLYLNREKKRFDQSINTYQFVLHRTILFTTIYMS